MGRNGWDTATRPVPPNLPGNLRGILPVEIGGMGHHGSKQAARDFVESWIVDALAVGNRHLIVFADTLEKKAESVLAWHDHAITTVTQPRLDPDDFFSPADLGSATIQVASPNPPDLAEGSRPRKLVVSQVAASETTGRLSPFGTFLSATPDRKTSRDVRRGVCGQRAAELITRRAVVPVSSSGIGAPAPR